MMSQSFPYLPPPQNTHKKGFDGTSLFYKRLLDKLGVRPSVFRREEFKAAMAPLTDERLDPHHRENLEALLGDLADQVAAGIAAGRRVGAAAVAAALDEAPLPAARAAELGIIDGAAYRDAIQEELAARALAARPEARRAREAQLKRAAAAARARVGGGASGASSGKGASADGTQPPPSVWGLDPGAPDAPPPPSMPDEARRSPLTGGPAVPVPRYLASLQWQRLQTFKQRAAAAATGSGSGASSSGASSGASSSSSGSSGGGGGPFGLLARARGKAPREDDIPAVVVVSALGQIVQAAPPQAGGAGGGDRFVESTKLVKALRHLREDPAVKAVVLRVNSPGGSAVASDGALGRRRLRAPPAERNATAAKAQPPPTAITTHHQPPSKTAAAIHREVALLAAAGKPVVASLGDVCASGGVYMTAPATRIIAQPGTITGSIGVIMTKVGAGAARGRR